MGIEVITIVRAIVIRVVPMRQDTYYDVKLPSGEVVQASVYDITPPNATPGQEVSVINLNLIEPPIDIPT